MYIKGGRRRNVLCDEKLRSGVGVCCKMFALDPLKLQQPGAESDYMSADLCNWDFLQNLDFAPDLEIDNAAISQVSAPHSSHERQKERNRQAQQRARQKKKVRKVCRCQLCICQDSSSIYSVCVPGTVAKHRVSACRDDQPASSPQVAAETTRSTKSPAGACCCQQVTSFCATAELASGSA